MNSRKLGIVVACRNICEHNPVRLELLSQSAVELTDGYSMESVVHSEFHYILQISPMACDHKLLPELHIGQMHLGSSSMHLLFSHVGAVDVVCPVVFVIHERMLFLGSFYRAVESSFYSIK